MPDASALRALFDRWEQVWHKGRFDLVPDCVAPRYVRHDEMGDRVVTREAYAVELAKLKEERPDVRILGLRSRLAERRGLVPLHHGLDGPADR